MDDASNIEQNYIDNELNLIMMSRVKSVLNEMQFAVLEKFLKGETYSKIAEDLNLSKEQIDLATLIGLLHDIARFEQRKRLQFAISNHFDFYYIFLLYNIMS